MIKKRVPNYISGARIWLIPILILTLFFKTTRVLYIPPLLFGLLCLTDWLDGYLAKKWDAVSDYGKWFDAFCDKVLIATMMLFLVFTGRMIGIFAFVLLGRDFWVERMRRKLMKERCYTMQAMPLAKCKTVFQMMGVFTMLLLWCIITDYKSPFESPWGFIRFVHWFRIDNTPINESAEVVKELGLNMALAWCTQIPFIIAVVFSIWSGIKYRKIYVKRMAMDFHTARLPVVSNS